MRQSFVLLLPLPLLALGGGCSGAREEQSRFAITNGMPEAGYPAVGKLVLTGGTCTGTLVGKQTVLTAAHCLGFADTTFVIEGGARYSAASTVRHPSYDQANTPYFYDVGIVRLQEAPSLTPATVASAPVAASTPVTLVGYGNTAAGAGDLGTKRSATNNIADVQPLYFTLAGSGGELGNACTGDSGGPVLIGSANEPLVVGVFSFLEDRDDCGVATRVTRLDLFRSWLREAADGDIRIHDEKAPVVTIRSPAEGSFVGEEVILEAEIDDDQVVTTVEVLLDGRLLEQATAPPYRFTLELVPGPHVLEVIARDAAANEGTAQVNVTARASEEPGSSDDGEGGCSLAGRSCPRERALQGQTLLLLVGLRLARRARRR